MSAAVRLDWRERMGIALVVVFSMALLLYVAMGEMRRTHQRFQTQRLQELGQPLQSALNAHLKAGLPLQEFAGFTPLTKELQAADPQLGAVSLQREDGVFMFDTVAPPAGAPMVSLPVQTRYETAGQVLVALNPDLVADPVAALLPWLLASALLLGLAGAWGLSVAAHKQADPLPAQRRVLLWMLLAQTALTVSAMWMLYSDGVRAARQSQAATLATRLAAIAEHGLSLDDFSDLGNVLAAERQRSEQVRELSLRVNDQLVLRSRATDATLDAGSLTEVRVDRTVQSPLEVEMPLTFSVSLAIPTSAVTGAIALNLKNFAFLLVATVFMSLLLLRLVHGFAPASRADDADMRAAQVESRKAGALLFLTVLCDQLSAAFLPPWIAAIARQSGMPQAGAAWAFTAYFISFAATLLAAERSASNHRQRQLMALGAVCVAGGSALLLAQPHYFTVLAARVLSGAGQAMVFVAAQGVLLGWSRKAGALGANSSIVYQFNAGMICGLALGSLLVLSIGVEGIFMLVCATALLVALLAAALKQVPDDVRVETAVSKLDGGSSPLSTGPAGSGEITGNAAVSERFSSSWLRCWRDAGFAVPALLVGIPAKAVMTGVVVYGLPLILSERGLDQTETGQLILFYALGVLLCNELVRVRAPATRQLRWLTAAATGISACALAGLALASGSIMLLLPCILLLGLAHGSINAPVVTLVGSSKIATETGRANVATYYRFVERLGHVAGPTLFAHVIVWAGHAAQGLLWVAAALVTAAVGAAAWSARTSRLHTGLGALFLAAACFMLPSETRAQVVQQTQPGALSSVQLPWLKLSAEALKNWTPQADDEPDAELETLWLRPAKAAQAKVQNVVFLIPKPSKAYDIAVSRMLSVWAERGVWPQVLLMYTRNDADASHTGMKRAARLKASLVMGVGSDAAGFLHENYRQGSVPLLSVCAKDPVLMKWVRSHDAVSGNAMAYTSLNTPVNVQLDYLKQARPDLKQIAILVDKSNSSAWQTQLLPLESLAREAGISVTRMVVDASAQETTQVPSQLSQVMGASMSVLRKNDPDARSSLVWITGSSSVFPYIGLINRLAGAVPVFSAVPDLVVEGADSADVSIGVSFEENAYLAAVYAQQVLSGQKRAGELPVGVISPPEIAINFMKARQSGLRLPFSFFEKADVVYNARGQRVRWRGSRVKPESSGGS